MKSSSGQYFIALDHVRALALFMVFTWHFLQARPGTPIPFDDVPILFPLALLDQGHTGVALFLTLSGYLFAKLLDGKAIDYRRFLWNRFVRLFPLLMVITLICSICHFFKGTDMRAYALYVGKGFIFPTFPNGGWSITIEFHYYLILPIFLWMFRKSKFLPLLLIIMAMTFRLFFFLQTGEVESLAYWTIIGRIDQFVFGMLMFQFRSFFAQRHFLVIAVLASFSLFYCWFDLRGGLYGTISSPVWIFLTTLEGLAYSIGIAWYDSSFSPSTVGVSGFIGRIGAYSYSLYLFHSFFVFSASKFMHYEIMDISNFYVACLWSVVFFILLLPIGYASFRVIEEPFLRLRKPYAIGKK